MLVDVVNVVSQTIHQRVSRVGALGGVLRELPCGLRFTGNGGNGGAELFHGVMQGKGSLRAPSDIGGKFHDFQGLPRGVEDRVVAGLKPERSTVAANPLEQARVNLAAMEARP